MRRAVNELSSGHACCCTACCETSTACEEREGALGKCCTAGSAKLEACTPHRRWMLRLHARRPLIRSKRAPERAPSKRYDRDGAKEAGTDKQNAAAPEAQIVKRRGSLRSPPRTRLRSVRCARKPPADLLRGQPQGAGVGAIAGADVAFPRSRAVPLQTWSSGAGPGGQKAQWSIQGGKTMAYASTLERACQLRSKALCLRQQLQASGPGAGRWLQWQVAAMRRHRTSASTIVGVSTSIWTKSSRGTPQLPRHFHLWNCRRPMKRQLRRFRCNKRPRARPRCPCSISICRTDRLCHQDSIHGWLAGRGPCGALGLWGSWFRHLSGKCCITASQWHRTDLYEQIILS